MGVICFFSRYPSLHPLPNYTSLITWQPFLPSLCQPQFIFILCQTGIIADITSTILDWYQWIYHLYPPPYWYRFSTILSLHWYHRLLWVHRWQHPGYPRAFVSGIRCQNNLNKNCLINFQIRMRKKFLCKKN